MSNLVQEALKEFGLTDKEGQVYIYLAKSCIQKAGTISKQLRMHKAQVYRILVNLRSKGLVKSTFELPMRFEALSFENFLDLMIKNKKEEAIFLEEKRDELLNHWNSITIECPTLRLGRFMIIEGRKNLFSMIFQIIERAENEVLMISDDLGLIQAVKMGLLDAIHKNESEFRLLTTITTANAQKIKALLELLTKKNSNITVNHVDTISGVCPCFIIKDNEEAVIFLLPDEDTSMDNRHENGIWTNRPFVFYTKSYFEELWNKSTNVNKKFLEFEQKSA